MCQQQGQSSMHSDHEGRPPQIHEESCDSKEVPGEDPMPLEGSPPILTLMLLLLLGCCQIEELLHHQQLQHHPLSLARVKGYKLSLCWKLIQHHPSPLALYRATSLIFIRKGCSTILHHWHCPRQQAQFSSKGHAASSFIISIVQGDKLNFNENEFTKCHPQPCRKYLESA